MAFAKVNVQFVEVILVVKQVEVLTPLLKIPC